MIGKDLLLSLIHYFLFFYVFYFLFFYFFIFYFLFSSSLAVFLCDLMIFCGGKLWFLSLHSLCTYYRFLVTTRLIKKSLILIVLRVYFKLITSVTYKNHTFTPPPILCFECQYLSFYIVYFVTNYYSYNF